MFFHGGEMFAPTLPCIGIGLPLVEDPFGFFMKDMILTLSDNFLGAL